jgi:hypothetical protein
VYLENRSAVNVILNMGEEEKVVVPIGGEKEREKAG